MATKPKSHPVQGAHTAGIFADMTVDGPDIGTLVAIVDRAKNLPNRKTIGKQDPYCAARLGKEARKTATDIRGGQTPKWDQELRFPVHDSPDYYQLKVSVFTDDKRTDLIGEAWIDLKAIVVPGGGQNDVWQTLSCRGKYAGEIRMEITYYDSRPKPDRPAAKPRQAAGSDLEAGSMRQRSPVKGGRPLPFDPVTGEAAPVVPQPVEHQQTPPRSHLKSSSHSGFVPNQSPLQAVEYNTPPPQARQIYPDHYSPSPQPHSYSTPTRADGPRGEGSRQSRGPRESYDTPPQHQDDREYSPKVPVSPYDQYPDPRSRDRHSPLPDRYDVSPIEELNDERPPPPPAHRARQDSPTQDSSYRKAQDGSPQKTPSSMPMRHDVLKNEAHRFSSPAYPGRPTFRAYDSAPPAPEAPAAHHSGGYDPSPRHHSYDSSYEAQQRSMQPTVEDAPDSPTGSYGYSNARRLSRNDELVYDSPPVDAHRSPAAASPQYINHSPRHYSSYQEPDGHGSMDFSTSPGHAGGRYHRHSMGQQSGHRGELEATRIQTSASYAPPALPLSLSPGVDPALAQDISDRIYEERRREHHYNSQQVTTPTRGRQRSEPPPSYVHPSGGSPQPYAPQSRDRRSGVGYSGIPENHMPRQHNVSPGANPNQQHTIRRKSVSPIPPPVEDRRLSDVPFGPDSYDALNTSMVSPRERIDSKPPGGKIIAHDGREVDPSDHLPEESWAPEPEHKHGHKQPSPEPRSRPSPSGAQPMPPSSGRRQLRIAARPAPTSANPPSYSYGEDAHNAPAPSSAGRNRLQKKTHRASMGPLTSATSPLAPISPDNYQDRNGQYTPTRGSGHRGSAWDYPNENNAPYHPGGGPPIPAKVPLMSGANGGPEASLMEEMQRIDIGAGRSRRRGGY